MCKRAFVVVSLVAVLSMAGSAWADLVAHWPLDEGAGTAVHDVVGNVDDGQLAGDADFVAGYLNYAVSFDGDGDGILWEQDNDLLDPGAGGFTVTAWLNQGDGPSTHAYEFVVSKGNRTSGVIGWSIWTESGSLLVRCNSDGTSALRASQHIENLPADEWLHVALVIDRQTEQVRGYLNGDNEGWIAGGGGPSSDSLIGWGDIDCDVPLVMGQRDDGNGTLFGSVDDVRVYDRALTEAEIQDAMAGVVWPYAFGPDPKDGSLYSDTWITLSWKPGGYAVSHDVYLGDDFDAVNDGAADTFRGNQTDTFYVAGFPGYAYPDGLIPGTTYYWRIDEVNEADPNSPWKGPIWSFSIPPKTAYNPDPADGMELADVNTPTLSWTPGFGAKLHTVYIGDDFDEVTNATAGVSVGSSSYSPGPLESEKVYYWRIDEFDGAGTYKGDVWTFTTPGAVGNPKPVNGADDVAMATILSWTSATNAASHQVYLGLDKDAVRSADASSPEHKGSKTLGDESYDPGYLDADATYYWRVDEVYDGNPVKGPVWSFTVGSYLLVDDFESYTDDDAAGEAIWQHWIDGFGAADNGAQVGYLMPPYAERTIIHGGSQSMPLLYTNDAIVTNSEAVLTLTAPRDWTAAGVGQLSLWFRGSSGNAAEPLYVAVSNSTSAPAVVAHEDPDAAKVGAWRQWLIPLEAFADQGIDLTNVDKIAIGLGSKSGVAASGGIGTLYIDDIRLYRP
ncbi:MAG: LamG domain-containing protein [Sedimentisphaerales bacterium]